MAMPRKAVHALRRETGITEHEAHPTMNTRNKERVGAIKDRLRAACVGKPAKIAWPHRLLHDAIAEIERLERELARAKKPQKKGTDEKIKARLAEHARRMAAYEANGHSREEASKRAAEDMKGTRAATAAHHQKFMGRLW